MFRRPKRQEISAFLSAQNTNILEIPASQPENFRSFRCTKYKHPHSEVSQKQKSGKYLNITESTSKELHCTHNTVLYENAGAVGAMGKKQMRGMRAHERENEGESENESERERERETEREIERREPTPHNGAFQTHENKHYSKIFSKSDFA